MKCCYYSCGREGVVREAKETPKTGTVDLVWCSEHAEKHARSFQ